jgi:hypothetical protein
VSLLLAGLVAAGVSGAALVGRWLTRRREPARDGDGKPRERDDKTEGDESDDAKKKADRGKPADAIAGLPCQLGDVIMRVTGEEAWLAGGVVLSEDAPVAVLFVAPDAGQDCAIYARPKPNEAVYWLSPLDPSAVLVGGEPPTSVEHEGIRFERARRLPLRPRRVGVGAPDVTDPAIVAEYVSSGAERLLVVKSPSGARAYRGTELEATAYEVIASGRNTLDES